mmetsp:Transcript_144476/g.360122  ORF Transcript_144476/g.360122 Transcript_144476/m.360122 type:complete len:82 (+) Transcript_144476:74-319(+)
MVGAAPPLACLKLAACNLRPPEFHGDGEEKDTRRALCGISEIPLHAGELEARLDTLQDGRLRPLPVLLAHTDAHERRGDAP